MLNIIFKNHSGMEVQFNDNAYRTWQWSPTTGNLILKRSCHVGCRLEIPATNILFVEVVVKGHNDIPD